MSAEGVADFADNQAALRGGYVAPREESFLGSGNGGVIRLGGIERDSGEGLPGGGVVECVVS